jgi:biopolymer transport protein ExbD
MGMNIPTGDGGGDEQLNSTINTTPLVDVMLVMLIIFLITIPVITHTVPLNLPKDWNIPTQTKPENITIAVDTDCNVFWNGGRVDQDANPRALLDLLESVAVKTPQPEVHIRGDREARYECIGRVVFQAQQAQIAKIGFITEPPPRT